MRSSANIALVPSDVPSARRILVSGLNHRTAPVEIRENFALSAERRRDVLEQFLSSPAIDEAVVISTCNRVEVVVGAQAMTASSQVIASIEEVFATLGRTETNRIGRYLYHLDGREAVSHLFRVASGLDSLILGEPQVLGQLKDSFREACACGASKGVLNRLFQRAFSVAKSIRTETAIGKNAVSVCYAARELARQIFGPLEGAKVLFVGAGEMGVLALRHFRSAGVTRFVIANKTLERAVEIAKEFQGAAASLDQIPLLLHDADIVVTCATRNLDMPYLVLRQTVQAAQETREGKPQFFIDLGVPRNVESSVSEIDEVFLYDIDDLQGSVQENIDRRRVEAAEAESIVQVETDRFDQWLLSQRGELAIREVMLGLERLGAREVERTMRKLNRSAGSGGVSEAELRAALEALAGSLTQKILSGPLAAFRQTPADEQEHAAEAFRKVFLGDAQTLQIRRKKSPN